MLNNVSSTMIDRGIPHRPTTPSHHRGVNDVANSLVGGSLKLEDAMESVDLSMSYPSTVGLNFFVAQYWP